MQHPINVLRLKWFSFDNPFEMSSREMKSRGGKTQQRTASPLLSSNDACRLREKKRCLCFFKFLNLEFSDVIWIQWPFSVSGLTCDDILLCECTMRSICQFLLLARFVAAITGPRVCISILLHNFSKNWLYNYKNTVPILEAIQIIESYFTFILQKILFLKFLS